ncbi:hypothetical protein CBL_08006 [Carabus blaptoides fortunei]
MLVANTNDFSYRQVPTYSLSVDIIAFSQLQTKGVHDVRLRWHIRRDYSKHGDAN